MWWWILIWVLLLLASAVALAALGWRLFRQLLALGRQLGSSADDVSVALTPIRTHYEPASSVLVDPSAMPEPAGSATSGLGRRSRRRA